MWRLVFQISKEFIMKINLTEITEKNSTLIKQLVAIWEKSVRATHQFLTQAEIERIKNYVPQAIQAVQHLIIAFIDTREPVGFMGIENNRLEMLFILPEFCGQGIGRAFVEYGIKNYNLQNLTVNEQNTQAVGFYKHLGFKTYKRTDIDEQGAPYPLLYMKLG